MKMLITCLLFVASIASASTIELRPVGPGYGVYRWQCAATGFASDNSIVGACMERHYGICSGRGCVPKIIVLGTWLTKWTRDGLPTLTDTQVAWPGCRGTGSVIYVEGAPYYFISVNYQGDELVEANCTSYLVTP